MAALLWCRKFKVQKDLCGPYMACKIETLKGVDDNLYKEHWTKPSLIYTSLTNTDRLNRGRLPPNGTST